MHRGRLAGVFYLLNIVAGASALFLRGRAAFTVILFAAACYVVVTVLFYGVFKTVGKTASLAAACVSFAGCGISAVAPLRLVPSNINPLLFFGVYCVLSGYLAYRSTFVPRILGVLMAIGGLGWLTFGLSALLALPLGGNLSGPIVAPGLLGESALTVWLLAFGHRIP